MFKTSLEELLSVATNVYRTKNAVNKTAFLFIEVQVL